MLLHYSDEINWFYNALFSRDDKIGHDNVGMLPKILILYQDINMVYNMFKSLHLTELLILQLSHDHCFVVFEKVTVLKHVLVRLLETLKISIDEEGETGAVLMDPSKAFDCI